MIYVGIVYKHNKNTCSVLYIKTIKEYYEKTSLVHYGESYYEYFTVGLIPLSETVSEFNEFT